VRFLVFLLVAGSLVLGLIAAASAYLVPLALDDARLVGLTAADAVVDPESRTPLIARGAAVDAQSLKAMRDAGVQRLRVEEFAFSNWNERWLFLLASGGLFAGAMLSRRGARRAVAESASAEPPESQLDRLEVALKKLLNAWPAAGPAPSPKTLLATLSPLVDDVLPAFGDSRPAIVERLGLSGFAAVMDRFSAAERQIHRAWSAAADGVPEETLECIERAIVHLGETRAILAGR
jgi:hypothetical protein